MTSIFTQRQNRTRQPKHTPGGQACENAHIQGLHTFKGLSHILFLELGPYICSTMTQDTKDKQPHTPQNTTNLAKEGALKCNQAQLHTSHTR